MSRTGVTRLHPLRALRILALKAQGYTRPEISAKTGVKLGTVRSVIYRNEHGLYKWQRSRIMERDKHIIAADAAGLTVTKTSEVLNCARGSVGYRRTMLGLSTPQTR